MLIEYTCEMCGKKFLAHNYEKRKFCSRECADKHHANTLKQFGQKSEKVKVVCAICGKVEYVNISRAKKYVTCSRKCAAIYSSNKNKEQNKHICPICGEVYYCTNIKYIHHKTCGKPNCRHEWLSRTRSGSNNVRYVSLTDALKEQSATYAVKKKPSEPYRHIAKHFLKLDSAHKIPKGYVIHHKDANHLNNNPTNLIVLPKVAHLMIHQVFGNIMINALHTGRIDRETFFKMCNPEQKRFYENIIDLDVTHQVVVKQGELLENPEVDNQHPSVYRNIYEGSTTNERPLACKDEGSNFDTSALHEINNFVMI